MKVRKSPALTVIVILLLLWPVVSTVSATPYYVATTGSDSNPGTLTQPWLTVAKAAGIMVAGDTTYIRGGTYHETVAITPTNSGSSANGYITFQNYQNETVTLDGTNAGSAAVFSLAGKSYIRVIGFQIVNYIFGISLDAGTGSNPGADHIEIRHCYIHVGNGTNGAAITARKGHDLIFADLEMYSCKNGLVIEGAADGASGEIYNVEALDIYSHDHWGAEGDGVQVSDWSHDILISGCEAFHTQDDAIDVRGYNITIENCIAHDCTRTIDSHGIKCYGIDPYNGSVPDHHVRVVKCFSYNNNEGIFLSALGGAPNSNKHASFRAKKMEVINCTVANNGIGVVLESQYDSYPLNPNVHNTITSSSTNRALLYLQNNSVLTANYNLWWTDASGLEPIDKNGTHYSSYLIENPSAPGSWYSATGSDLNSRSVDPGFVDKANKNFALQSGSVCIDTGTDEGLSYTGAAPDMGAFESGAVTINCPTNYLTAGENWISIPVAAENDEAYSVFKDLGAWPNSVYHNIYRYNSPTGSFAEYPTYQSDPIQFGKIIPGGAYKLMLGGNQSTITVSGITVKGTQTLAIGGSGTRDFYFGNPFNRTIFNGYCRISYNVNEVSIDDAIANGWIGNPRHFNAATKSWETIGDTIEKWNAYKLTAYNTSGELKLVIHDSTLPGDLNYDGRVNYGDLALFVEDWLVYDPINVPLGDFNGDNYIDFRDFAIFAQNWVNHPPSVDAGQGQTIINPVNSVNLNGTVTDDGMTGPVSSSWTVTSGPGTVTFGDATAIDTTATFSAGVYGTYVLRLTASDSELSAYDEVTINYLETVPLNQAPVVNAGPDQQIAFPASAILDGTVTDDGLPNPPSAFTTQWTMTSGPGIVTFGDAGAVDTTVSFSVAGTYVLRLTANDSALSSYDEVTITTIIPPPPTPASITYPTSSNTWEYTVSWSPATGATSYQLERSDDGGDTWSQIYTGSGTSYAELIGNGSYRYRVKASNSGGQSDWLTGTYDCVVSIPPLPSWSESADYYVDGPSGTDSGTGTASQPFKTFAKAVSTAAAGKKVLVWGNQTYSGYTSFTTSGTSSSPITFKRDPASGTAVLDGAAATKGVLDTTTAGFIVIDGFKLTNAKFGAHLSGVNCSGWVIKNCRVTANTSHGISIDNGDGNLLFNNAIYLNDSGNNGVDITASALNTNVIQCSIYGQYMGVYAGSGGVAIIRDCIITNNGKYGVRQYGGSSSATTTYSDVWSNPTNYSNCSAGTGCISVNPLLVNPAAGDFHLGSGSPSHNTASDGGDMGYRYSASAL